jgi:mono/diheme cytochrome c family protein
MQSISTAKKTSHPELVEKGKGIYDASCASCHGVDGAGVQGVGISLTNLANGAMINGKKGEIGAMPAFDSMLTEVQFRALNEYIYSLNN